MIEHGESDLLEVVCALCTAGGLAGRLNSGQQKRDKDANDRDDNQKFD
jgi:hypothetical protein